MHEIWIRLEIDERVVAPVLDAVRQFAESIVPAVQQTGGTGQVVIDGQPVDI